LGMVSLEPNITDAGRHCWLQQSWRTLPMAQLQL
jgi:hypothetical protein